MIRGKPTSNLASAAISSLAIGLFVYCVVVALRGVGVLQPYELLAYDLGLKLRQGSTDAPSYVTIVQVTEHDIAELGRWPLSDAQLNDALQRVAALHPRAIGLDIYRDIEVPPGRAALDATLQRDPRIFCVTKLPDAHGPGVPAPASLADSERVGFNDVLVDNDGIVRRALLFMDDGDRTAYAFGLRLAMRYLADAGIRLAADPTDPQLLRLGAVTVPPLSSDYGGYVGVDAAGYQFLLDYARPQFAEFSFGDLMDGRVPAAALRDRVVLLGVAADSVKDDFYAPLGRWLWHDPARMAGVELHAHIVDQLLRFALDQRRPIASWSSLAEHAWILLWALAGAVAGLAARSARRLGLLWFGGSIAVALVCYLLFLAPRWVPFVPAWLAWLGASGLMAAYLAQLERRDRQVLQDLFATHVSEDVAKLLWERRHELVEGGELRPMSVVATMLFVDLRGFTTISETLPAAELMRWLNRALQAFTHTILAHGGIVDDYFGDGIKATFGVIASGGDVATDARRAVDCARALARATDELNAVRGAGEPAYAIRIGIHTGAVLAGTVGSARRRKFTTVGDAVNLAARLEALHDPRLDAASICQIIVSESTRSHLDPMLPVRAIAAVHVKGKRDAITVYQIVPEESRPARPSNMEALQT
jgi:adenylate cyclase